MPDWICPSVNQCMKKQPVFCLNLFLYPTVSHRIVIDMTSIDRLKKRFQLIEKNIMSIVMSITVKHIYDACPKYSKLGKFCIIAYLYVSDDLAAADSASTVRKKYSVFIYSEAEPHAMYAIYKQTLTLCVLQESKHIFSAFYTIFSQH